MQVHKVRILIADDILVNNLGVNNKKLLCRKSNRVYLAILIALNFSDSKEASNHMHETDHNNYYYIIYVYVIITNNNANLNNVILYNCCVVCA